MRVPRIYIARELGPETELQLPPALAHRLGRVLRLPVGARLRVFDGRGGEWNARLQDLGREQARIRVGDFVPGTRESPLHTVLGLALARGKRTDWALQKAVELGLNVFQPLFSEHSELQDGGAQWREKRLRHWNRVAIGAAEQSGRTVLTRVCAPLPLQEWLPRVDTPCRLVLHPEAGPALTGAPAAISLLAGAEGGFSAAELQAARDAGFAPFSLGPRVLRSETAPLAALAVLQHRWGDGGATP